MLHLVPIVRSLNRLKVIKETSTSPAPSMLSTSIVFMTEQSPRQVAINLNNIDDSRCIEDKLLNFFIGKAFGGKPDLRIYTKTQQNEGLQFGIDKE
jgi:hypothetical protein